MKILHMTVNLSHKAGGLYSAVSGLTKAQNVHSNAEVSVLGACAPYALSDLDEWGDVAVKSIMNDQSYGPIVSGCQAITKFDPDIIHQHGIWNAASVWGRYALAKGIPMVVSPHGMLDPWILKRSRLKKRVHGWLLEKPIARSAYFNALTKSEVEDIEQFCPSSAPRISIVPNGISLPSDTIELSQKSGALFLGRLHEKKQILELVEAWSAVKTRTNLDLVVAGWGDEGYVEQIKGAVAVANGVTFVGAAYGEKKKTLLANAKVFLLPSLSEGLPMAVLESISYGCIPIITDECNLSELIGTGVAERLELDLVNLHDCIMNIVSLNQTSLKVRQTMAIQSAQDYSWPHQANSLISFYEEIIGCSDRK